VALGACVASIVAPLALANQTQVLDDATLAARFRPLFFFDSAERWRPLSVQTVIADGQIELCATGATCTGATSLEHIAVTAGGHLDVQGRVSAPESYRSANPTCVYRHMLDCDDDSAARLYYHVVAHGPYRYIDYWVYYRFNDAPAPGTLADHESDWEGLTVAVPATDLDPRTFAFIEYAAHGGVYRYLRSALLCGRPAAACRDEALHVHGYVAHGTHATYPRPCGGISLVITRISKCRQNGFPWVENRFNGRAGWAANDAPVLEALPETGWTVWPGNWNVDDRTQISSPGRQVRFQAPWNATCIKRWSEEPGQCLPTALASGNDPCASWAGPFTAAAVCDPAQLTATLEADGLQPAASAIIPGANWRVAAVQGLTQAIGPPLKPGQKLTLRGPRGVESGRVYVRVQNERDAIIARFDQTGLKLAGRAELRARETTQGQLDVEIVPSVQGVRPITIKPTKVRHLTR
jgi:hypothetical protein